MNDFLLVSKQEAEELSAKNNISLENARKILESTAITAYLEDNIEPIFDNEGFFVGTRTKLKQVNENPSIERKWGKPWSMSLKELFDINDED